MIKIESKKNKFTYNVYHVTKAFYPKEDIVQTVDEKQEPLVKIHLPEGTCFSLAPEECVQTEDVQEEKRDVTKKVYQFLSKQTGQKLAWGMLTGVRPTKLVMQKIEQGMTKEEIFQSVAGEIKTSEMKLEQRKQMRNILQHDAREALEKVCGKKAKTKEVQHMTLEGMEKGLRENTKHQMEYVNSLKQNTMNSRA